MGSQSGYTQKMERKIVETTGEFFFPPFSFTSPVMFLIYVWINADAQEIMLQVLYNDYLKNFQT